MDQKGLVLACEVMIMTPAIRALIRKANTHEILGCQIIGAEASTMIAEVVLAMELGATCEDLERVIHAHPTMPEGLHEAVEDVLGRAVHIAPKRKKSSDR